MSAERDIVARSAPGPSTSTGALAAYLQRTCGHVVLDSHVMRLGYRFYPDISDEIPHFFNRRLTVGDTTVAVTLQAGIDMDGNDPFDGVRTPSEARALVESEDYSPSTWKVTVTVDGQVHDVADVAEPTFIARSPGLFRAIADELVAVGALPPEGCQICSTR